MTSETERQDGDSHLELGLRIAIAKARGELPPGPGEDEPTDDSRKWADYVSRLLEAQAENAALKAQLGEARGLLKEALDSGCLQWPNAAWPASDCDLDKRIDAFLGAHEGEAVRAASTAA